MGGRWSEGKVKRWRYKKKKWAPPNLATFMYVWAFVRSLFGYMSTNLSNSCRTFAEIPLSPFVMYALDTIRLLSIRRENLCWHTCLMHSSSSSRLRQAEISVDVHWRALHSVEAAIWQILVRPQRQTMNRRRLMPLGSILFAALAILVTIFLLWRSEKKKAAVGRR